MKKFLHWLEQQTYIFVPQCGLHVIHLKATWFSQVQNIYGHISSHPKQVIQISVSSQL